LSFLVGISQPLIHLFKEQSRKKNIEVIFVVRLIL